MYSIFAHTTGVCQSLPKTIQLNLSNHVWTMGKGRGHPVASIWSISASWYVTSIFIYVLSWNATSIHLCIIIGIIRDIYPSLHHHTWHLYPSLYHGTTPTWYTTADINNVHLHNPSYPWCSETEIRLFLRNPPLMLWHPRDLPISYPTHTWLHNTPIIYHALT